MRQDGGRDDAQRQMIGLSALTLVAGARSQPQASRDRIEHVFIGGPGQQPSRPLHRGACMACDGSRDPPVELRRAEMPSRHCRNLPPAGQALIAPVVPDLCIGDARELFCSDGRASIGAGFRLEGALSRRVAMSESD